MASYSRVCLLTVPLSLPARWHRDRLPRTHLMTMKLLENPVQAVLCIGVLCGTPSVTRTSSSGLQLQRGQTLRQWALVLQGDHQWGLPPASPEMPTCTPKCPLKLSLKDSDGSLLRRAGADSSEPGLRARGLLGGTAQACP